MSKSTRQWFAGILITLIGGFIVWLFAKPGVTGTPPAMKVIIIPEVKIIDDSLPAAQANKKIPGVFTIYNSSDSVVDYTIKWDPGVTNGNPVESERFRINPHSNRRDTLVYPGFKHPGIYQTTLTVYAFINNEPKFSSKYTCDVLVTNAARQERKRK